MAVPVGPGDRAMTRDVVIAEFGTEVLARHNFFKRHTTKPKEVGIYRDGETWVVYMTDERGEDNGTKTFTSEESALTRFGALVRYFSLSGRDQTR
jgi:hypothetical protein